MIYLERVADEIRAEVPPDAMPSGDDGLLFDLYAVLALACGKSVTAESVHNAWVAWMRHQDQKHDALVPYGDLDSETAAADLPFVQAIRVWADRQESTPEP